MPRKTTDVDATIDTDTPPATDRLTTDDKLDLIVTYLHQMNRRDKLRTVGAFIHGIITVIPIIIFVFSAWYFYAHGTEVLKTLTDMSVKSAASYSQQGLLDQFNEYIGKPKQ